MATAVRRVRQAAPAKKTSAPSRSRKRSGGLDAYHVLAFVSGAFTGLVLYSLLARLAALF